MQTATESSVVTLAETLSAGALPLAAALGCAKDIASGVSLLHQQGLACGRVDISAIEFGPCGATIPPPTSRYRSATPVADVHDFGVLLYHLLTGAAPAGEPPPDPPVDHAEIREEDIRNAALRLAFRCHNPSSAGEAPEMRIVALELRLLSLTLSQVGGGQPPPPAVAAPATASTVAETVGEVEPALQAEPATQPQPPPEAMAANAPPPADGTVEPVATGVICPCCSAPLVYVSRRRGFLEAALWWAGPVYRCHRCWYRYLKVFTLQMKRPRVR